MALACDGPCSRPPSPLTCGVSVPPPSSSTLGMNYLYSLAIHTYMYAEARMRAPNPPAILPLLLLHALRDVVANSLRDEHAASIGGSLPWVMVIPLHRILLVTTDDLRQALGER